MNKKIEAKPEEPIHQRINFMITELEEGVQKRFATRVGVAPGVVNDIIGIRKSKPGFDIISKILSAYPQVSPDWFILGQGEMLKSARIPKNNFVLSAPPSPELHIDPDTSGNKRALYINYKAAAHYSGYQSQEGLEAEALSLPPDLLPSNSTYFAFPVTGESMEPTFYNRDIVIAQEIPPSQWLGIKGEVLVVVVSRSNGLQLKRVSVSRQLKVLQCRSDNPVAPFFTLSIDDSEGQSDVLELWAVSWRLTKHNDAPRREPTERIHDLETAVGDLRYLIESVIDEREINRRLRERERSQ